jgi:hypothetical protein
MHFRNFSTKNSVKIVETYWYQHSLESSWGKVKGWFLKWKLDKGRLNVDLSAKGAFLNTGSCPTKLIPWPTPGIYWLC